MKYYLVAGEKSGDLHASNLMKELKKLDANASFKGLGGDKMIQQGLQADHHIKETAVMMFLDVVKNLRRIAKIMSSTKHEILSWNPDVVILVDYGGFNLRLAKYTKRKGFTNFYYISPKIWAWRQGRALQIKKYIDQVFSIIHFEKAFYTEHGVDRVTYVGNPVCDAVKAFEPASGFDREHRLDHRRVIAVLPGSRKSEVTHMLSIMLEVKDHFPDHTFVVAGVDELDDQYYEPAHQAGIKVIKGRTYDLLHIAEAAVVTSGTATLETAMLKVPQVVCYKMGKASYMVVRSIVKVKYISLVNLLNDKATVKELIQDDFNALNLIGELNHVLGDRRQAILDDYDLLEKKISTRGASLQTAESMWHLLNR